MTAHRAWEGGEGGACITGMCVMQQPETKGEFGILINTTRLESESFGFMARRLGLWLWLGLGLGLGLFGFMARQIVNVSQRSTLVTVWSERRVAAPRKQPHPKGQG